MDTFDRALLCQTLHCQDEYFTNRNTRECDLLFSTENEMDSVKSNRIKAKLQGFINDFTFL